MTRRVLRRPAALRDLDEAAEYIRRRSGLNPAIRFLRAASATFDRLAGMPGTGTADTSCRTAPIERTRIVQWRHIKKLFGLGLPR